ncbi:MAG: hypothetical protein M5U28_23950 [Sandaracinaceae bacterium]|nr:hypothetical protein [Sandaracinaceae bacterium]
MTRWCLFILTLSLASGCDCSAPPATTCSADTDCQAGFVCRDGRCVDRTTQDGGTETDARVTCEPSQVECAGTCCPAGQVCSADFRCALDCGAEPICGGACCAAGDECLDGRCVIECADEAQRCGADGELCCAAEQACLGGGCVDLGGSCTVTEECELDEICEPTLMRCVPRTAVEVCEYRPPVGEFTPVVACRWQPPGGASTYGDVVMTPGVMNLTDDNGDGETNTLDIPDVVFVAFDYAAQTCCTANGRLVIASGACNSDGTMRTHAIIDGVNIDNSTGVALGNLHPDSMPAERNPEIVVTMRVGAVAFVRAADDGSAWTELWRNSTMPSASHTRGGAAPSLADLDGDGAPEVIIGNVVLNGMTGAVVWDGLVTVGAGAGVGNNAFLGPSSTVADLDLDGHPEVIAGNTVYDGRTGAEIWTYTYTSNNSPCGGNIPCDGFNGVGNFDDDPEGEVVIVRRGEVFVLNHDGTLLHQALVPRDDVTPYAGDGPCANNESGPPTIADFDGDGRVEIGTAGADFYVVVDFDCTGDPLPSECARQNVLWLAPNHDCSSRATGSSVFDFEGDGAAEVVYADEQDFWIFDGRTGAVLYRDESHTSNTRLEMPIVVDVDNDGKSEVLVPVAGNSAAVGGLFVWEDADNNWVRTRRVWNQHPYHVTNITEDGQVPRYEEPNWRMSRLNNFRQNVQPGGLFDAPDLTVTSIEVGDCVPAGVLRIAVTVENRGALGVPPGIAVWGRVRLPDGTVIDLGVVYTATYILPGGSEVVVFEWMSPGGFDVPSVTFEAIVDDDGTGAGAYNECDETNNGLVSDTLMTCMFG